MRRIINKGNTGKTRKILEYAKENNAIVVCQHPISMKEKSYEYGIFGLDFINYATFYLKLYDTSKPVVIDELETMLKMMNTNLVGYTITVEE